MNALNNILAETIKESLLKLLEPVGQVNYFYATTVPDNYLIMDGTHWSKTTYPELWLKLDGLPNVSSDAIELDHLN